MSSFHLYLDSADLRELRTCLPHPVVHGVTTNPTLLKRAGVTRQGLQAGAHLSAEGVPVTCTAIYAAEQAHFAASLGAAYAAPYLGRLQDAGIDGLALIGQMQSLIDRGNQRSNQHSGTTTRLLVASVRTREAYLALLQLGVGAITIPPRLLTELLDHPATLEAERGFLADAATL
ncbi:MAG: transaldolase [Methylibium sp. NZG]|nr:MAG: transaldolase [Methylibium sp. NZG]